MRILFLTPWYPRENNPATGIYVRDLAIAASLSNQVLIIHGYCDNNIQRRYIISEKKENKNIRVVTVKYKSLGRLSYLMFLYSVLYAFKKIKNEFKPDIIHAHTFLSGLPAIILGKLYKLPVVISEHVFAEKHVYSTSLTQKVIGVLRRTLARLVLNEAGVITVPSYFLRRYLRSIGVVRRIELLPNIVDTSIFHFRNYNYKNEKNIKKILYVGNIHPIKGIFYLLYALKEISRRRSDFMLDIIGDGPIKNECMKLVGNLNITDKVIFHGLKPREEIAKYMKECDFLVLPSLWESFGIVLAEAMACGKPVVTTLSGGQREFISKNWGILIPSGDSAALAKAIEYMLDHCDKFPSRKISRYVELKFSYEVVSSILNNIYLKMLEEVKN